MRVTRVTLTAEPTLLIHWLAGRIQRVSSFTQGGLEQLELRVIGCQTLQVGHFKGAVFSIALVTGVCMSVQF